MLLCLFDMQRMSPKKAENFVCAKTTFLTIQHMNRYVRHTESDFTVPVPLIYVNELCSDWLCLIHKVFQAETLL